MVLGVEMHGSPLSINSGQILRGRTVTGSMFGGVKTKTDIPFFVKKYLHNVSFSNVRGECEALFR